MTIDSVPTGAPAGAAGPESPSPAAPRSPKKTARLKLRIARVETTDTMEDR
ncbi:hypothetical protein [Dactylosporangium sp. NPDC051484]|uniref:hypothetical protein n=1 Tax=Dactylosporangium sp. NPDC051484 TaxID=3154942 RepID=UPI00344E8F58